ncbi:ABC transporter ATP-binding protein [Massilia sp. BSC265]|uniref:iron ABC transporter ATP-binding protein n=1 Tax=Massilia sp. BSC265 TaxID=1549812 RepID=UPI0004E93A6D|nr:ATP-binding cassette domain-containing protein [Massilia sp. BSC265]KFI08888.1 iron ABC transporter ATP-binding protein [Massilia sp. BSC265]
MIEVKKLSKRHGDQLVVDDVTLTLPASGIVSIIGPNGAGKSSLLTMISRLMPMSAGSVQVDGMDVATTPTRLLSRHLAILRQDNQLVSRLTVRDLVAFGRYPHSEGRLSSNDVDHIDRAVTYMGLEQLQDRFIDELSGGQRQRAFVAMVLCQDTDYVLLDEPLNNLDMKHAQSMMKQLRHAVHVLGKTVVVVLHDINFASCYSDFIVAMRDGKVVHQGTPEETVRPNVLHKIYGMTIPVQHINGKAIAIYYE